MRVGSSGRKSRGRYTCGGENIKTKTIGIGRKLLEGGRRAENRENRILENIIF